MDSARFDALTRVLSSRRTAMIGALGGLAALLSLPGSDADAHNPVPACNKIKNSARRRACLRRARQHNRSHICRPQPPSVTCANRCGPILDNCRKQVNCTCPANQPCDLGSGTCICLTDGQNCTSAPQCCQETIPTSCAHSGTNTDELEGPTRCCRVKGFGCTSRLGCCAFDDGGGGTWVVSCSPGGTCGGAGAACGGGPACASGTCIGFVCQ
jgi:hypothetical protein